MKASTSSVLAASLAAILLTGEPAHAQGWGDIKGQVIWTGAAGAGKEKVKVDKDQAHCLKEGDITSDELVIDAKTSGIKNVMVWLAPLTPTGKLPIHPDRAAVPKDKVVITQPCCMFEPRITMMREGQKLEVKNPAPVLHNAKVMGGPTGNGTFNLSIPAGQSITKDLKAEKRPMLLSCDVHGWMRGRICIFNHPYYALTKDDGSFEIKNAPAGKYRIFILHEGGGWLHKQTGAKLSDGQEIDIKAGGALGLGRIEMKKVE